MEIDVNKCKFHETDDSCVSVINKKCTVCSKIPIEWCYYKQLQQYKQLCEQKTVDNFDLIKENEELKKKLKYAEKEYYILAEEYAEFGCFNFSEEEKQIKYPEIIKEELCEE